MRFLRAIGKFMLFSVVVILISIFQPIVMLFTRGPKGYILPRLWHKATCFIFGIRVHVEGTPASSQQTIFMSNHISYLDIPVLGSLLQASFVAKQEVATWPLFGFLATLQQTAFLERKKSAIGKAKNGLQGMMNEGKSLIIFPEGTSTDGQIVRPFKTSLFELARNTNHPDLLVQPVTIRVDSTDGHAITTQDLRDLYSWHIDMDTEFGSHLWRFAQTSGCELTVTFHSPLQPLTFNDRKSLSQACFKAVSGGLKAKQMA